VGCAGNLEYLRSYGFKTFSKYWDESYDTIADPIARMQAVTGVLKNICNMSSEEQQAMLLDIQPILEHNYNLFNDPGLLRGEWKHLLDQLKSISGFYKFKPPYTIDLKTGQAIPLVLQDAESN
jgi:hypothetical protein